MIPPITYHKINRYRLKGKLIFLYIYKKFLNAIFKIAIFNMKYGKIIFLKT